MNTLLLKILPHTSPKLDQGERLYSLLVLLLTIFPLETSLINPKSLLATMVCAKSQKPMKKTELATPSF